eukprot:7108048-Pyramimonas_sp.AAC.2
MDSMTGASKVRNIWTSFPSVQGASHMCSASNVSLWSSTSLSTVRGSPSTCGAREGIGRGLEGVRRGSGRGLEGVWRCVALKW